MRFSILTDCQPYIRAQVILIIRKNLSNFSLRSLLPPIELLLFDIPTNINRFVNLYIDNFINICLDKIVDGIYEATRYFNIITNIFNLFFSNVITKLLNKVKRKIAIFLRKLKGKRTPSESKKVLG